jgi:hypothetical protein
MEKLIEALQIMLKYGNSSYPTHCEHDILYVNPAVDVSEFSQEDIQRLEGLHFNIDEENGGFYSFFYGG